MNNVTLGLVLDIKGSEKGVVCTCATMQHLMPTTKTMYYSSDISGRPAFAIYM